MPVEDDRVVLLNESSEPVEVDDLQLTDPTGMFSLTEIKDDVHDKSDDKNGDIDNTEDEDPEPSNVTYVAAVIAALGGLLFGYDIGIISGAKIQIQKEIGLSCVQIQLIVVMLPVGAMVASILAGTSFLKSIYLSIK